MDVMSDSKYKKSKNNGDDRYFTLKQIGYLEFVISRQILRVYCYRFASAKYVIKARVFIANSRCHTRWQAILQLDLPSFHYFTEKNSHDQM